MTRKAKKDMLFPLKEYPFTLGLKVCPYNPIPLDDASIACCPACLFLRAVQA